VFFVISGFLIGGHIFSDLEKSSSASWIFIVAAQKEFSRRSSSS